MTDAKMVVIYDGDCPFCRSYVSMMALRKRIGSVELIDARSSDPRVKDLQQQGYDLNEGMITLFGGKIYYGSDALALISDLSSSGTAIQVLLSKLLGNPNRARIVYPLLKFGRRTTLWMLGKQKISAI